MDKATKEFLADLANVLEKHNVSITSELIEKEFTQVTFAMGRRAKIRIFRCHITAYDCRIAAGLTTKQANKLYKINKILRDE